MGTQTDSLDDHVVYATNATELNTQKKANSDEKRSKI